MKTWKFEMMFAAFILSLTAAAQPSVMVGVLSSTAVFLSFGHMCVSERLRERQVIQQKRDVECVRMLNVYLWTKEVLWIGVFALTQNYAALAGCFLFLAYPFWRLWWRSHHPLGEDPLDQQ